MDFFVYHFQVFLLILLRMSSMMVVAPFYSSAIIPFRMKAALAFMISIVVFPIVAQNGYTLPGDTGGYFLMILQEIAIGIFIGFLVSIIFSAFQLAGQYFAVQIGFGINEVLDPLAQVSIPIIGQIKNLVGLLVFLSINGHHFLVEAVYRSYQLAPVFGISRKFQEGILKYVVYSFSGMFVVAMKIALPVLSVLFLIEVSMGILAKVAPQMNIMMLGFPFKIVISFMVFMITAPLVIRIMQVSLERTFNFMTKVLIHWPI